MPSPRKGEKRRAWLDRCMVDPENNKTFPEANQRYAVCNSEFDAAEKKRRRSRRRRGVMRA